MNNCEQIMELIALFPDGLLSSEENKQVLNHVEQCDECAKLLEDITLTCSILNEDTIQLPKGLHDSIIEKVKKQRVNLVVQYAPKINKNIITLMASAAALVIVGSSLIGMFLGQSAGSGDLSSIDNTTASANQIAPVAMESATMADANKEAETFANSDVVYDDAGADAMVASTSRAVDIDEEFATEAATATEDTQKKDLLREIELPKELLTESYAFFMVANIEGEIPVIDGQVIYTDKENSTTYIAVKNDMMRLEDIVHILENSGAEIMMPDEVLNSIDKNAEQGIIIVKTSN